MPAEVLGSETATRASTRAEVYRVGPFDDPDRYEIGEPVEAGAEGVLYRGRLVTPTSRLSLSVAVKALQPVYSARIDQWAARWRDQVELLRSLHIPGLVGVREGFVGPLPHLPGAETAGRNLYLVMNWVEGEALDHWVLSHRDADVGNALKLLLPVAVAVDTMHGGQLTGLVPVVHRDIKPANILISKAGSVLVDFGLTKGLSTGTPVGRAGTPGYIAPEVVAGGSYTPAADRFAFGATVFFLLTGRHPAAGMKTAQLRAVLEASAVASSSDLVGRVLAMMDPDPQRRPAALANWIAQLRQSSLDEEILSVPLPPPAPVRASRARPGGVGFSTGGRGSMGRTSLSGSAGTIVGDRSTGVAGKSDPGGSVPTLDTVGLGVRGTPGHRARRGPMHARPRAQVRATYALAVVLAVTLVALAGDLAPRPEGPTGVRLLTLGAKPSGEPSGEPSGQRPASVAVITPAANPRVEVPGTDTVPQSSTTAPGATTTSTSAPAAKGCFRSLDPTCGAFRWDPQPVNRPLTVTFTYSPTHPQPGDLVTFDVTLDDPDDAHNLAITAAYFGSEAASTSPGSGIGGAATGGPTCSARFGSWPPPSPGPRGHTTIQEAFRYPGPGSYPVHFSASTGETPDPCALPDPYASTADSGVQTVVVDAPPPPPTTTTTSTTTIPPAPVTTTTVAPSNPPSGPSGIPNP